MSDGGKVGLGMGDSQILLGNYNAAESPSPLHLRLSPPNFRAPVTLILFCMKASVLIYDFFSFLFFCSMCVLRDSSGGEVAMTFIKAEAE